MSDDTERDYEVGYGKPPKQHQWKKGQPGNPSGGASRVSAGVAKWVCILLEQDLRKPFRKPRSCAEGIAMRLVKQAFDGDRMAIREILAIQRDQAIQRERNQNSRPAGWTIIHAKPVFDSEESRLVTLSRENEELKKEVARLRELVAQASNSPIERSEGFSAVAPHLN